MKYIQINDSKLQLISDTNKLDSAAIIIGDAETLDELIDLLSEEAAYYELSIEMIWECLYRASGELLIRPSDEWMERFFILVEFYSDDYVDTPLFECPEHGRICEKYEHLHDNFYRYDCGECVYDFADAIRDINQDDILNMEI